MRSKLLLAAAVAAGLLSAHAASAAKLFTTSLSIDGTNVMQCSIVNVGSVPGMVTIFMVEPSGQKAWSSGAVTIAPGQRLVDTATMQRARLANYCAFEVSGSAASYRAAAENIGASVGSVAIAPAQ